MRSQMLTLGNLLIQVKEEQTSEEGILVSTEHAEKIVTTLLKLYKIFNKVLESPGGRIMDCLLQMTAQTHTIIDLTKDINIYKLF